MAVADSGAGAIPQPPLGRAEVQVSALALGGHHLGDSKTVDGDGHLEMYKSTMKYDGDLGRRQHGLPPHKELPL